MPPQLEVSILWILYIKWTARINIADTSVTQQYIITLQQMPKHYAALHNVMLQVVNDKHQVLIEFSLYGKGMNPSTLSCFN